MAMQTTAAGDASKPLVYQIRLAGHLGQEWAEWFGALTISLEADGATVLTGSVVDQAALHGLLRRVRDVGAPLISVRLLDPSVPDTPDP